MTVGLLPGSAAICVLSPARFHSQRHKITTADSWWRLCPPSKCSLLLSTVFGLAQQRVRRRSVLVGNPRSNPHPQSLSRKRCPESTPWPLSRCCCRQYLANLCLRPCSQIYYDAPGSCVRNWVLPTTKGMPSQVSLYSVSRAALRPFVNPLAAWTRNGRCIEGAS